MPANLENMKAIVEKLYETEIHDSFGSPGVETLISLLRSIKYIYRIIDPEMIDSHFYIFKLINSISCELEDTEAILQNGIDFKTRDIVNHLEVSKYIEVVSEDSLIRHDLSPDQLKTLTKSSIVYHFFRGQERIIFSDKESTIKNPYNDQISVFSTPTYTTLNSALNDYGSKYVQTSKCDIFKEIWADDNRLFLTSKPEKYMRNSLEQFLIPAISDAVIEVEHNVDESNPVDIKVTWELTKKDALVEIKWMGDSVDGNTKITTRYRPSRANDGAGQLIRYLDKAHSEFPDRLLRGYLVVIDARRRGLSDRASSIIRKNGFHYKNMEITYKIKYHTTRKDYEKPLRLFAEPNCSD